ncbi:long-chain fatty acid--CoA ligase [Halogeometricum borinquense]|uniref:Long-chain fatty acid--CoA ligase n=1 Tax=Halogeometricum borinquense TaxID=60847 RepID=A0A6C0UK81_9EURY|nr:long-chain fatty acid--CoA ligase [Halogeometricum borinquense]QIB75906.1 long-chain fatty acid--CoA ligase [Halogeometricum borinquense]QIQ75511.1 long-chain fatty acid--CoA ligase [Halogeometricum borinquense]
MDWRDSEETFEDEVVGDTTLARMFENSAARNTGEPAQQYKGGIYDRSLVSSGVVPAAPSGDFSELTYGEMREIVRNLAAGFRELGVEAGSRVGIFSHTRMEWAQSDFGILAAGGAVTTVYTSSSERQVRYLLSDPGATGVVVENAELLQRVLAVEDELDLSFIVLIDDPADGSGMGGAVRDRDDIYTLGDVHEIGATAFDEEAYQSWINERDSSSLASLIYTSGTTGQPKGVKLTHNNFRSNVNQCYKRFGPRPDKEDVPTLTNGMVTLSFLPLAHVLERLAGHFLMFASGACVAYAESPDTLREDFQLVRPTVGTSVPRVYEKLYDAIRSEASKSPTKKRIFEWAVDVGREYHESDSPGVILSAKHALADKLVFDQVREALGGRIEFFISGGGSLSAELCALYHGMGLPILEGYGLTETSPVIAVNPPEEPKIGTIGTPVVDVEVKLDKTVVGDVTGDAGGDVGELLVKGPNVTEGYWNRPEETAAAFTDDVPSDANEESESEGDSGGWFRTGDVVELRPDGYIAFRERAKQILVLSTGKNVAPGPIEDSFASSDVVEQCMVLGDGRKFVSALIVPSFEEIRDWADREGYDLPDDARGICRDDRVKERIQSEIDQVNENFEPYEQIKQFRLVPEEFTENNDLMTPTMKKKRRNILDRYADQVDLLYTEDAAAATQN